MRLVVLGASGRTGRHLVAQALERGWHVVAASRSPIEESHDRLTVTPTDVLDPEQVRAALEGAQSVISALGVGSSRKPTVVYSRGVENVLAAMAQDGPRRIAVVSASPVGSRDVHPWFTRVVVMRVLDRFFGASYEDMLRMEDHLRTGTPPGSSWISVRPPRLIDKPGTGRYRWALGAPPPRAGRITIPDLATALLDAVSTGQPAPGVVYVAN